MTDAYTCGPDERALVDRLIEEISVDGDVFVHLTLETARRAGELRFEAMAAVAIAGQAARHGCNDSARR